MDFFVLLKKLHNLFKSWSSSQSDYEHLWLGFIIIVGICIVLIFSGVKSLYKKFFPNVLHTEKQNLKTENQNLKVDKYFDNHHYEIYVILLMGFFISTLYPLALMLRKFQMAPNGSVFLISFTIIFILLMYIFNFFSTKHSLFRKKIKCKRKLEVDFLTDSIEPLKIDWDNIESLSFKKYWIFFGKMFLLIRLKEKVCPTQKLHKSR